MNDSNNIRQQFQSKLNDFEPFVPSVEWERIEASLAHAQKVKVMKHLRLIGSIAASVVLIVGGLLFFNTLNTSSDAIAPVITQSIPTEDLHNAPVSKKTQTVQNQPNAIHKRTTASAKEDLLMASNQNEYEYRPEEKNTEIVPPIIERQKVDDKHPAVPEITERREPPISPNNEEFEHLLKEFENAGKGESLFEEESKKEKKPISLALNVSGGLTSSTKAVNRPMTLRSASSVTAPPEKGNLAFLGAYNDATEKAVMRNVADNISKMHHNQPVSAGITVSKAFAERFSVETGLMYTYLYSKLLNANPESNLLQSQHFHYLGIPVNVNYRIFSVGGFNTYFTIGAMVEKDIYGEFRSNMSSYRNGFNSLDASTSHKIKQKNPQYSLSTGLGISYPIYRGFNLYGKMGGSYYFNTKNEYKTIYSDKKIILDLRLGIRYDF